MLKDRYCDTVSGDWLIDYHPDYENLIIASGDSGSSPLSSNVQAYEY
jgi:hypothetical protein